MQANPINYTQAESIFALIPNMATCTLAAVAIAYNSDSAEYLDVVRAARNLVPTLPEAIGLADYAVDRFTR